MSDQRTFAGSALTLEWPEETIALATMTREREMNTLTLELIAEMGRALDTAERAGARAFIITGTGRAFCCGAHLKYFTDDDSPIGRTAFEVRDNYLKPVALLFDRLETMRFPVIAAINGFALGGGCEMSISADFRVMSTAARIGVPEVRLGATPGAGGVQKLQRLVGRGKALEWILLGKHVGCEEAERHGLLFAATPPDELMPTALDLARRLAALSPLALAQAKASVYVSESVDLASARRFGLEALSLLIGSADWREGMRAFIDKREPRF
jgi:enoyl-CoA hydratase